MGMRSYLNVGESKEGKGLTRRETRTIPLGCFEDACLTTGKARNMRSSGTLAAELANSEWNGFRLLPFAPNGRFQGGPTVPNHASRTTYPLLYCRLCPSNFARRHPFPGTSLELWKAVQVPGLMVIAVIQTRYSTMVRPCINTGLLKDLIPKFR
jgi:hypothetical protein